MSTAKAGRLLIADDDPNLLAAYVLFFEAYGYTTQTATDGMGALATYCASNPDIVMLDIQMPPMDGHAMAREIRRLNVVSSPLLLAVTALCAPADRADPLKAGFDDHFVKPAQLPAILAAMVSHTIIWADRIGQKSAISGRSSSCSNGHSNGCSTQITDLHATVQFGSHLSKSAIATQTGGRYINSQIEATFGDS